MTSVKLDQYKLDNNNKGDPLYVWEEGSRFL